MVSFTARATKKVFFSRKNALKVWEEHRKANLSENIGHEYI